jgi:hypothetical protein
VLHISTPGDAADVNPVIQFLPHTLQHPMVDSSHFLTQLPSSGKIRKYAMMTHYTLGEFLYLLICSFLLCLLVIALQSSEIPEGFMNNPVYACEKALLNNPSLIFKLYSYIIRMLSSKLWALKGELFSFYFSPESY